MITRTILGALLAAVVAVPSWADCPEGFIERQIRSNQMPHMRDVIACSPDKRDECYITQVIDGDIPKSVTTCLSPQAHAEAESYYRIQHSYTNRLTVVPAAREFP